MKLHHWGMTLLITGAIWEGLMISAGYDAKVTGAALEQTFLGKIDTYFEQINPLPAPFDIGTIMLVIGGGLLAYPYLKGLK